MNGKCIMNQQKERQENMHQLTKNLHNLQDLNNKRK